MDSGCVGLQGKFGLPWQGVVSTFYRVVFSSRKVVLAIRKEANYY